MKKKLISILLISSMTLALVTGCGGNKESNENNGSGETAKEESAGEKITFMVPDWGVPTNDQLAAFTDETGIEVEIA